MDDVRVASWNELQDRLFEGSWNEPLRRHRSRFAFRGMGDAGQDLTTSLARLGGPYHEVEHHLLRDFKKYARHDMIVGDSVWTWLALAQHHGLPTRLLDWTFSPFVAMHFATANVDRFDRDGVIWRIDRPRITALLPPGVRDIAAGEDAAIFTVDMLDQVAPTLQAFDALAESPFVVFLEPPSLDERIVNQFALFSLISDPRARLDRWLTEHPGLSQRIVIPADLKWEVRDKLDQANVTERVLLPGLDGLARWLRRYYLPRPS